MLDQAGSLDSQRRSNMTCHIFRLTNELDFIRLLRLMIFAAIITVIVGSAEISSALDNSSKLNTVKSLREASYIISLGQSYASFSNIESL